MLRSQSRARYRVRNRGIYPPTISPSYYEDQIRSAWNRWTEVINRNNGQMPAAGTPDRRLANTAVTIMHDYLILRRRALADGELE